MTRTIALSFAAASLLVAGAASAATTKTTTTVAKPAAGSRMVTTKTKTGKTITYDCSKAGNATKTACKK